MKVVTFTPIRSHLNLKPGVNEFSKDYQQFIESLEASHASIQVKKRRDQKAYRNLSQDDRDTLELFTVIDHNERYQASIEAHVFNNTVSVVEIKFDAHALINESLEHAVQDISSEIVEDFYRNKLFPLLQQLPSQVKPDYLEPVHKFSGFHDMNQSFEQSDKVKQMWTSRMLRIENSECETYSDVIRNWLKDVPNPEIAEDIISGRTNHSLEWLNYVVAEKSHGELEYMVDTMCLAQYLYTVQDVCNSNLYQAISNTYLSENSHQAEKTLSGIRATTRFHISGYFEMRKYMTRKKKDLLIRILDGWEFASLVDNSERLIDVCSNRISDIHSKRAEKSSYYTDLILVFIGFISLFDLALTLSEYSRVYTASATLGYRDDSPSSLLTAIASFQTDNLFLTSVFLIVITFVSYVFAKRR